jgi:hypothetical protein
VLDFNKPGALVHAVQGMNEGTLVGGE